MATDEEGYIDAEDIKTDDNTPNVKRRSIVWSCFEKINRFRVRCRICNHEQNYQGTTGNILRHLKTNHQIDITIKGQAEGKGNLAKLSAAMQQIKNQDADISKTSENHYNNNSRPSRSAKNKVTSYVEEIDIDPYTNTETTHFEKYLKTSEEENNKNEKHKSVEEQRILAEIEYFREKAAYYRMQKNLVALQAKKIKYELDQLF